MSPWQTDESTRKIWDDTQEELAHLKEMDPTVSTILRVPEPIPSEEPDTTAGSGSLRKDGADVHPFPSNDPPPPDTAVVAEVPSGHFATWVRRFFGR